MPRGPYKVCSLTGLQVTLYNPLLSSVHIFVTSFMFLPNYDDTYNRISLHLITLLNGSDIIQHMIDQTYVMCSNMDVFLSDVHMDTHDQVHT